MAAPRSLFKEYGNARKHKQRRDIVQHKMCQVTQEMLQDMTRNSTLFQKPPPRAVPRFHPSEIRFDQRIGMGEFGVVVEVAAIHLNQQQKTSDGESREVSSENISKPLHAHYSKFYGELPSLVWESERSNPDQKSSWLASTHPDEDDPGELRQVMASRVLRCALQENKQPHRLYPTYGHPTPHGSDEEDYYEQQHETDDTQYFPHPDETNNVLPPSKFQRRYAVKYIRKDLYPKKKIAAARDLAKEAQLLRQLDHPNIARLRGTVGIPGNEQFMIIMDRLQRTLSETIDDWVLQMKEASKKGAIGTLFMALASSSAQKTVERSILSQRLLALYDVAQAMRYLHSKSIVFRDLKPENVARNHRGAFQLIDFGLAKEVKQVDRVKQPRIVHRTPPRRRRRPCPPMAMNRPPHGALSDDELGLMPESPRQPLNIPIESSDTDDESSSESSFEESEDTYQLTGLTGTVRIMSPEVLQCQPYGLSTDVYSFGVVLWEVFAGCRNLLSAAEVAKGQRPALPVDGMPPRMESLLRKAQSDQPAMRPTFAMLCQEIEYQLLEVQQQELQYEETSNSTNNIGANDTSALDDCMTTMQYICLDPAHHNSIFHRFDYLRQLSVQSSLALGATTATNT